jgi:hypothetical protein
MTQCKTCGIAIRFIASKKDKTKIAVENKPLRFLPANAFDRQEWFVNRDGIDVKGCRARDGMTGYKRHECQ